MKHGYIEYESGLPADGHHVKAIHQLAKAFYTELDKRGAAPSTWSDLSGNERQRFEQQMEEAYPELALCQDHWKVNAIATAQYPAWIQTRSRRAGKQKLKMEEKGDAMSLTLKRGSDDSDLLGEDVQHKRLRPDLESEGSEPELPVVDKCTDQAGARLQEVSTVDYLECVVCPVY